MTDRCHGFACFEETAHETEGAVVAAKLVGIHDAAREHQSVVILAVRLSKGNINSELIAPLGELPSFDFD